MTKKHSHNKSTNHDMKTRYRTILDNIADGVLVIDQHGTIIECNPRITTLFGYNMSDLLNNNIAMLIPKEFTPTHPHFIKQYLTAGKPKIMGARRYVKGIRSDKSTLTLEISISKCVIKGETCLIGVLRDATELKQLDDEKNKLKSELETRVLERTKALKTANRELKQLAWHDTLTNLPNRNLFTQHLREALAQSCESIILIMMDLDHFKDVNETLGHQRGDLLLKAVSKRLLVSLRESDIIARLGGDEFAILLTKNGTSGAHIVAEKILRSMEPAFSLENHTVSIKASLGIAVFPEHGTTDAELMQHADVAMYEAKRKKTGYQFYDSNNDLHTPARLTLVTELRNALKNKELQLHYQPKIDTSLKQPIGVEALIRWQHSQHGLLFPDQFIPLAEQHGLIDELTYLVVDQALAQCSQWHQQGLDISIAVNLSANNLKQALLPDKIQTILEKWSVIPSKLILEITETSIISEPEKALKILTRLDEMGITLSIDDYGTGYSSLAYVKKLPVDEVKIDRSFVKNIITDREDAVIVKSTIDLAHKLGMRVVAEGVEDKETGDALCKLGCDYVQGYYYSKPIDATEITTWLQQFNYQEME
ncbi:MAG: EAL domain-containing protein [Gammaproteobacteria bacterium]|nr:EAL domain-containing protein [Gammaproteobacteria bacterium]